MRAANLQLSQCLIICLTFTWSIAVNSNNEYKIIQTEYGPIRGVKENSIFDEKPFYAYRGIPYAQPPTGNLRYQPLEKPVPWTTVRDAIYFANECPQISRYNDALVLGQEDCLYLNVFVPDIKTNSPLPVMVYIHGGGYYYGSGHIYGPDFLIDNDVILVTFNYRLGVLGFLSLGTVDYPGNVAMKDQREVLKWVNRNIKNFGGDTKRITLFGESAGAASTHFHMLSPTSKDLFQRVILQSGSALTIWSHRTESPDYTDFLYGIVRKFGHDPKNNMELMNILQRIDTNLLIRETNVKFYKLGSNDRMDLMLWKPLVEVSQSIDPFLSKFPEEYLLDALDKKFDMMVGYTSAELFLVTGPEYVNLDYVKGFEKEFKFQLPWPTLNKDICPKLWKEISQEIRNFYYPNGVEITQDNFLTYVNFLDDLFFTYAQHKSAFMDLKRAKDLNIFFYVFDVVTDLNVVRKINGFDDKIRGTSHLEELFYIFRLNDTTDPFCYYPYEYLSKDTAEVEKIREISKIWGNFAKFGHPSPKADPPIFKPFTMNDLNYVNITNAGLISAQFDHKKFNFWDNLLRKYQTSLKSYLTTNVKDEL